MSLRSLQLATAACIALTLVASAEDLQLRQRAVILLDRANTVSAFTNLPTRNHTVRFTAFYPDKPAQSGEWSRTAIAHGSRRDETTFGDYHFVVTSNNGQVTSNRSQMEPPEIREMSRLMPIWLVRFDHADVINGITTSSVGSRSAKCIQFDTQYGNSRQSNEACVDAANGTLLRLQVGSEVVENSDFYSFGGALVPRSIRRYVNGALRMEIEQSFTELKDVDPALFVPPPGSKLMSACQVWRAAVPQSRPQPPAAGNGVVTDVTVHLLIDQNGQVVNAAVVDSDRTDLEAEALKIAHSWSFQPAICDGRNMASEMNIALHFQGR